MGAGDRGRYVEPSPSAGMVAGATRLPNKRMKLTKRGEWGGVAWWSVRSAGRCASWREVEGRALRSLSAVFDERWRGECGNGRRRFSTDRSVGRSTS